MSTKLTRALLMVVSVAGFTLPMTLPAATSDAALAAKVEHALASKYRLQSADIHVHVDQGVVRLTGTVASGLIVDQAEDAVSDVPGVAEVNNQLKVRHRSR